MSKKKGLLSWITNRILLCFAAFLLMITYLTTFINPAKIWFIEIFGIVFIPLVILNLVLLVWAIIRRSKAFLIPFIALLPSLLFIGRYIQLPGNETKNLQKLDIVSIDSDKENQIKMLSYNVGRFTPNKDIPSRAACMDSIAQLVLQENADIICLQEFYIRSQQSVNSLCNKYFPNYQVTYYTYNSRQGKYGNVTLSRLPVTDKGVVKFENSTNLALYTDHVYKGKKFRIYNCHFQSYNISIPGIVNALGKDKDIIHKTELKMRASITRRPIQVDQVLQHIENCPIGSVVCGDFNSNPMSYTYHRLSRGRKDCFEEAGKGVGATYSILWPFLRIDYILVPSDITPLEYKYTKRNFSDHYPITSTLKI